MSHGTATPALRARLWGVRGSVPVSGPGFRRYGGNTMCIELRCGPHAVLIDAGTGLVPAGLALRDEGLREVAIFLTHSHYDHLIGLPFFALLQTPGARVTLGSGHLHGRMTTAEMLDRFLRPPFFPVGPEVFAASLVTADFAPGTRLAPFPGVTVATAPLNHPGGSVGYRVEWGGRAVAVVTDTEHEPGQLDPQALDLARGADLLLYDATYDEAEFAAVRGWGHSTWQQALRIAEAAGVARVGLMHHAEGRSDAALDRIGRAAARRRPGTFCARDGQVIDL